MRLEKTIRFYPPASQILGVIGNNRPRQRPLSIIWFFVSFFERRRGLDLFLSGDSVHSCGSLNLVIVLELVRLHQVQTGGQNESVFWGCTGDCFLNGLRCSI